MVDYLVDISKSTLRVLSNPESPVTGMSGTLIFGASAMGAVSLYILGNGSLFLSVPYLVASSIVFGASKFGLPHEGFLADFRVGISCIFFSLFSAIFMAYTIGGAVGTAMFCTVIMDLLDSQYIPFSGRIFETVEKRATIRLLSVLSNLVKICLCVYSFRVC